MGLEIQRRRFKNVRAIRTPKENIMKEIRKNVPALLMLLLILGVAQGAFAQVDPPERVARLNLIEGAVSYLPSGVGEMKMTGLRQS